MQLDTRTVATQITPLVYRTQGLQFYRDGLHALCVDKMNWGDGGKSVDVTIPQTKTKITVKTTETTDKDGKKDVVTVNTIDTGADEDNTHNIKLTISDYNSMRVFLATEAIEAIKAEIPVMLQAQQAFYQNVRAGIGLDDFVKITNAVKPQTEGSKTPPADTSK